jgi:NAD(P)-dependent dehydrogenase (short-subunit alcohol dehydrogenase family)
MAVQADLGDLADRAATVRGCRRLAALDILVKKAGVAPPMPIAQTTEEASEDVPNVVEVR